MVAPLMIKVPPPKYGGSEFVIYYLTEELIRRGHEIDLYATEDSETSANLIPVVPDGIWKNGSALDANAQHLRMMFQVGDNACKYDVIHEHLGPLGTVLAKICDKPIVSTLHVPTTSFRAELYDQVKDNFHLVSISNNQRSKFPSLNYAATVYNGVPVEKYEFDDEPDDYLFFLGRFDNIKGASEAIKLAKTTGEKLIMAARIEDEEYYKKYIKPEIDGKQIQYVGEVGFAEKVKLLKKAKALVSLINWEEPFGLIVPEANACGTPIIATARGSYPELIRNGVNGFLTDGSLASAAEALKKISQIKRADCRHSAETNFSVAKMTEGYEKVYRKVSKIKD